MNQNTEKWYYFFVALIFAFLISSFLCTLKSHDLEQSNSIINTSATVILAVVACYGISQWKNQLRGADKYKALIDIKIKFLEFKKKYQAVRLTSFQSIDLKTDQQESILKAILEGATKQLWDVYHRASDSINFYEIIEPTTNLYLDEELYSVKDLMSSYLTSINIFYEHITNKNKIDDDDTLNRCEKYIYRHLDESDEISQRVIRLKKDIFDKIDIEQKQI